VSCAKPRRRFGQCVQYFLQIERGPADDLEHVGGGDLLLQRLVPFADDSRDLRFLDGIGGTTTAHSLWRNAALARCRLATLRFNGFATCSEPPSHRRPSAQDKAS